MIVHTTIVFSRYIMLVAKNRATTLICVLLVRCFITVVMNFKI